MWTGPKFESDLLKTNKDVGSSAKSRNFTDVYVMGQGRQVCSPPPPPPTIQTSVKFRKFLPIISSLSSDDVFERRTFTFYRRHTKDSRLQIKTKTVLSLLILILLCWQNKRGAVFVVFVLILGLKHTLIAQNCLILPNHCDVEKNITKYHWYTTPF